VSAYVPRSTDARDAILHATIRLFAEAGSRGATTRRIAETAGVNEVTLFRLFHTKTDLIRAALRWFAEHAPMATLPAEPRDPVAELSAWCRDHHRQLYRVRALLRTSMGEYEEHPEHCEHAMRVSVRIARELTDYLSALQARGLASRGWDPAAAAAMLMGTVFADAMGRDTTPERYPFSMRAAIDKYLTLFFRAIDARPAKATRRGRRTSARGLS
jgi:AcrR family transcriptional regulator